MSDDQHEDQAAGGVDPLAALGRQIAEQLAEQLGGDQVDPAVVTALAGEVRAVGERVDTIGVDVAQLGALVPAVQELSATVQQVSSVVEKLEAAPPAALADWLSLGPEEAEERWRELAYWVQHTLVPGYGITRALLPDCWPMHRPAMVHLSWMYATYRQAYAPGANPNLAAEWSTRWLRDGLDNISSSRNSDRRPPAVIREENCRARVDAVGVHMMSVDKMRELEARERAKAAAGAAPSEMSRQLAEVQARSQGGRNEPRRDETEARTVAGGKQLAARKWWDGYWKKAQEVDVAWRRERAGAEEDAAR